MLSASLVKFSTCCRLHGITAENTKRHLRVTIRIYPVAPAAGRCNHRPIVGQPFSYPLFAALLMALCSFSLEAAITIQSKPGRSASRSESIQPVRSATAPGAGQAGYVHYFIITHPDGTVEDHVGIEMEDQRIAWSFPGSGVSVSDFIKNGTLESGGKTYRIEHQHAVRPFRTEREMRALHADLGRRIAIWVDDETPYCVMRRPDERFCLSCGDFVVRVLYPSTNPLSAGLPRDFVRITGQTPTTDDLLLYMLGLQGLQDARTRLDRLATLDLPDSLRKDVRDMLQAQLAEETTAKSSPPARRGPRIATRKIQSKRL